MVLPLKDNGFTNKAQLINKSIVLKNSEGITNSDRRRGMAFEFVLNSFGTLQEFCSLLPSGHYITFKIFSGELN